MPTISELKEQAITETPLLLLDCKLADGRTERWSTHRVEIDGVTYEARVLRHNLFEIQAASDQGVDGIPRITLTLADADSHFSQIERTIGMKGAGLAVRFLFYDLKDSKPASESSVVFQGVCNPPEEITEATFRVSATNRLSMQRVLLPQVRIQRRCPWNFPASDSERAEAADGGANGKYSRFYRCGYSAGDNGGQGTLDGSAPFASCSYTREDCAARGMSTHFGGLEFVPSTILVRTFGDKGSHLSTVQANEARYNDFVPMVYGTAWCNPPVVFARNDGNLTRMEVLLGIGEIAGVLKVLVNGVEIPLGRAGTNMTGTGWYNAPTLGTRTGGYNLDFVNADGTPAGNPYGSMAYLAVVVPNRINDGRAMPAVQVLMQGLKVPVYDAAGLFVSEQFTNNPAWVILDVLRRSGWRTDEIDLGSIATAAAYCEEAIPARDVHGNALAIARFECNLVLRSRRSVGDVIRGVRNAARLFLTYNSEGKVKLGVENTLALQQPAKPKGSNATQLVDGGWPAYEFGDGTYGLSGVLRSASGASSLRVWARGSTDTGNRFSVEFQDALNEYQQDSFSLVDAEDVAKAGQEITAPLSVLGLPNYDQAARILKFHLDRSLRGNLYVEFESSVKAVSLRPGDLITLTYLKEGFDRQVFRVLKIAPGTNYATAKITAQIHDDAWHGDQNGQFPGGGSQREGGAGIGIPRPLAGAVLDSNGLAEFSIQETATTSGDGSVALSVTVGFLAPSAPAVSGPAAPLLSLTPAIASGGSIHGPQTVYYAVSGLDASGSEGPLSFVVRALIPGGTHQVTLTGLSFARGTTNFNVYRGATPLQLHRIAANQPVGREYTDNGAAGDLVPAPDANFDHANFYWRSELLPEVAATVRTANTIGNSSLQMAGNRYRGAVVRITRGTGAGQERTVASNTDQALMVAPAWDIVPDASSLFTVAEASWKFGAVSRTSPVHLEVPNRPGEVVQICGRAANVNDQECAAELSPVTRWQIGGSGASGDGDAPPAPIFGISPGRRGGTVDVSAVSFEDLANTHTITSGTLTLYWWNELQGQPTHALASALGEGDTTVALSADAVGEVGSFVQIEAEIMRIEEVLATGRAYRVTRAVHHTAPAAPDAGTAVYHLSGKTLVTPFPREFFGSPYSGSWTFPVSLPDVRLASAELFVTNDRGNGPVGSINLTQGENYGLRTCSGGQYSIQVGGYLSVDDTATPALLVEATHAVRDIYAVLGKPSDAAVHLRLTANAAAYCELTIPAGSTVSSSVNGFALPPLETGARLSLSILAVGQTNPGEDLTVILRL